MRMGDACDSPEKIDGRDWANLPHVVLIKIFQNLPCLDRICVRYVCESWSIVSSCRDVWKSFDFFEKDIDESITTLQEVLDEYKADMHDFGINSTVSPRTLYQPILLDVIRKYGKYFQELTLISGGDFISDGTVSAKLLMAVCEESSSLTRICLQNIKSGQCQEKVCTLLQRNRQLQNIRLISLKFDCKNDPLPIGLHHALTLKKLYLVNSFKSYNLGTLMYLVNLKELAIEPQFLSYSLLHHLTGHSLTDLYIVAISRMTGVYQEALQDWHWQEICKQGPNFRVHFRFSTTYEWTEKEIILKPSVPVKSIIYYKYRLVHFIPLSPLVQQYFQTLETFVDYSNAMVSYEAAHNISRNDIVEVNKSLLDIVRQCQNLQTLAVKEVLASSTLLAMASLNKNLKDLCVMEDQIIYENITDTAKVPEDVAQIVMENWTQEKFVRKMSVILGIDWHPLCCEQYLKKVARVCNNFVLNR